MIKIQPLLSNRARLAHVLIVCGLLSGVGAILLMVHQGKISPRPPGGALRSQSAPSSLKPSSQAVAGYTVPPTNPKFIAMPSIGLTDTRVMKLGLAKNNQIAVPNNVYDAGWYEGSAKPGQTGAMFIYGHVSSWTAKGAFYNLKKLKPGDAVTIIRGDNKTFTYQAVKSVVYPYDNVPMNQVLAPINSGAPGLNLMTCTGQIIKGTSEFNERLVVFTSLVTS